MAPPFRCSPDLKSSFLGRPLGRRRIVDVRFPLPWKYALLVTVLCCSALGQFADSQTAGVRLSSVPASSIFADAIATDALKFACADSEAALSIYFRRESLAFDAQLVRRHGIESCHIVYRPTLPGFRALPESAPLRGLLFDVEPLSLLSQRRTQHGDSLDIAKTIFPRLPSDIEVTLGVAEDPRQDVLNEALDFHFRSRPNVIAMRESRQSTGVAWAQDYMKSGELHGRPIRLLTRLTFEGRSENGARYKPTLDALRDKVTVRSRLSWEGGDLQFHADPRDPSRTILIFGDAAKRYWGDELSTDEYAYVLKQEFGADEALDFSGIVPHVDYLVSVLPKDGIVLVAEPMHGNASIAHKAVEYLLETFGPNPEIVELEVALRDTQIALGANLPRVNRALEQAKAKHREWAPSMNGEIYALLAKHQGEHCPENPEHCFRGKNLEKLLGQNKQLLRAWVNSAMQLRAAEFMPTAMLSVIESQLPNFNPTSARRITEKVQQLEARGFRVIRAPLIGGDPLADEPWSGISYVNSALVGTTLFVPAFGFGEPEQEIFDALQASLKPHYTVVPVNARYALLQNGGVHCVIAFLRDPPLPPSSTSYNLSPNSGPERASRMD